MTAGPSRAPLVLAAGAYAAATAWASVVAVRRGVPGEPFGLGVPLSVPTALRAGWGAGIAAPWQMPVIALVGAVSARPGHPRGAAVAGTIGAMNLVGHAVEPVTWGRRGQVDAQVASAMTLSLASAAALAVAGTRTYRCLTR